MGLLPSTPWRYIPCGWCCAWHQCPALHCRHWDGHKGKTDANKSVAKSKLCPPVPMALPACCQQYNPRNTQSPALLCFQAGPQLWEGSFHSHSYRGNLPDCGLPGLCPGSLLALPTATTTPTLSYPLVNLLWSINMSYLNLFWCFDLAWFELPSSLLHFALNPEQLCRQPPAHASSPGMAGSTKLLSLDFEMVCETPHHVLATSGLLLLSPAVGLWLGWSPASCSMVKPSATSLWCGGNFASSFSQHFQVLLNLNNHNPGLLLQLHWVKMRVPKALLK